MIKILEHGFIAFFLVGLGWVFGGGDWLFLFWFGLFFGRGVGLGFFLIKERIS